MSEQREEMARMITYFWQERGDPTRYSDWEKARKEFPEVAKCWDDYRIAERIMDAVVEAIKP